MSKKVIIDCDPGHDDIMAIMLCLSHPEEFDVLGFTTVCGNQLVEKVTNNLCSVLTVLNKNYPVAMGQDSPIYYDPEPQPLAHGESGLDGPILPTPKVKPIKENAIDFIRQRVISSEEKITIIALAPLTNIALFLKAYPELKNKIEAITLMGGAIEKGNILSKAEFNIYEDPHAAKIVFESGVPIIMSGIEVCEDCSIPHEEIDALKGKGKVHDLAHDILQFFSKYNRTRGINKSPLFDVAPVMHLLHPEYFTSQKYPVYIEVNGKYTRGMTVVDKRVSNKDNAKVDVLLHCDSKKFISCFLDGLNILEKQMK